MLKVEIDGREVEVPHGATVMDATKSMLTRTVDLLRK